MIKLELEPQEIDVLLNAMADRPFKEVFSVFAKVQQQTIQQMKHKTEVQDVGSIDASKSDKRNK